VQTEHSGMILVRFLPLNVQ